MKKKIKLSKWAKLNSYSYRGAYNLFITKGIAGAIQMPSGAILIEVEQEVNDSIKKEYTVVYSRVSSSENKTNLEAQADRCAAFCTAKGWIVNDVVKECASGMNDSRPKLLALLRNKAVTRIVVEHKDRLTRFGFEYIKALFHGEIIIINEVTESKADLVQDFISIITSFCARICGQRRCKRNTEKFIEELQRDSLQ